MNLAQEQRSDIINNLSLDNPRNGRGMPRSIPMGENKEMGLLGAQVRATVVKRGNEMDAVRDAIEDKMEYQFHPWK